MFNFLHRACHRDLKSCQEHLAQMQKHFGQKVRDLQNSLTEARKEIEALKTDNDSLLKNQPRIRALLAALDDLNGTGESIIKLTRVNPEEIFIWRNS